MSKQVEIINETQDIVLDSFKTTQKSNLPKWIDSLKVVAETSDELIQNIFGTSGQRLKRFALRANLNNPDIESYFMKLGNATEAMYRQVADVLVAVKNGADPINIEKDFLAQDENFIKIIRLLQQPYPRLLISKEDRKNQRDQKKQVKSVGLKNVLQSGTNAENNFYGQPDHFKRFARFSVWYREELKQLNDRQSLFQSKSMTEMSHFYAKRVRELEESLSDALGYYRIKPNEASVILARLHGFRWEESHNITVSSKFFEDCKFWVDSPNPEINKVDELKKALILNTRFTPANIGIVYFGYQARLYPLSGFPVATPEKAQKIIDQTESLNNLNDSPFFDYYWLLVPSININHPLIQKQRDQWIFKEGDVNIAYKDSNEAALFLDQMLIKSGHITPIIIGERDGESFFLCHFA